MELGWMRIASHDAAPMSTAAIRDAIAQTEALGFRQIHLPELNLNFLRHLPETETLRFGLDVSTMTNLPPRALAEKLHCAMHKLNGRLVLGLHLDATPQSRITSQVIETLLSDTAPRPLDTDLPMCPPRPEVLVMPEAGNNADMRQAAANGFHAMSPAHQSRSCLSRHWPALVAGATHATRRACPSHWHVARCIYVSDNPAKVAAYCAGPAATYFRQLSRSSGIDKGAAPIAGSVQDVAAQLQTLRARIGPFGVLHCIDPGLGMSEGQIQRQRLAKEVLPRVNGKLPISIKELEST